MAVSTAYMQATATWTGARADALRRALGMTNESFAEHLGVSVRTVAYWRKRRDMVPQQQMQDILDTALDRAPGPAKEKFALVAMPDGELPGSKTDTGAALLQPLFTGAPGAAFGPQASVFDVALIDVLASADMENRT